MTATPTSSVHGSAHGPAHGRSDTSVVSYLAYLGIVPAVGIDIMRPAAIVDARIDTTVTPMVVASLIFGALGLALLLWAGDSRELVRT